MSYDIKRNTKLLPILLAVLFFMQLVDPSRVWTLLLAGLGSAWLAGYLWARALAEGLSLQREMRFGWAQVGDRVEVYFPGYGWIEFEPTAGRPAIQRAEDVSLAQLSAAQLRPKTTYRSNILWRKVPWPVILGGLAGILALVASASAWGDYWRLRHQEPSETIFFLYRRVQRQGRSLKVPVKVGDTPHEFAQAFAHFLSGLARTDITQKVCFPVREDIHHLADLYTRVSYSPHPIGSAEQSRAIQVWTRLRWRLWIVRLMFSA